MPCKSRHAIQVTINIARIYNTVKIFQWQTELTEPLASKKNKKKSCCTVFDMAFRLVILPIFVVCTHR